MSQRPSITGIPIRVLVVSGCLFLAGSAGAQVGPTEKLDAVFANGRPYYPEENRVCLGDGAGGFACSDVRTETEYSFGVALGFVDGDQNLDAVFSNQWTNRVCLGDGSGGFACSNIITGQDYSSGVALGFLDGDDNLDAVFAYPCYQTYDFCVAQRYNTVCLGNGAGGFACFAIELGRGGAPDVALGFVDADQNLDAVFSNAFAPFADPSNRVCLGDGAGGFSCSNVSADLDDTHGVALGFVDGDDNLDAVFANGSWVGQRNRVCLGDGAGGFACSDVSTDEYYTNGVALGHVDGDGNLDAVFANGGTNRVCFGDGAGGFRCSDVSTDQYSTQDVALGFVDGDDDLDAVFANGSVNRVCLGDGAGGFSCGNVSDDWTDDWDYALGVALGEVNSPPIFADGFESGDTSAWSATLP